MHEHDKCEHDLKYCKICDVCYCEKCHKEWVMKVTYVQYPTTWIGTDTYPNITYYANHTHGKDLE